MGTLRFDSPDRYLAGFPLGHPRELISALVPEMYLEEEMLKTGRRNIPRNRDLKLDLKPSSGPHLGDCWGPEVVWGGGWMSGWKVTT